MKKQMGFTLIEIVMVLVLLGILSAVAVPKYFDLQERAMISAAQATVAEVQARLNARFAAALLAGKTCTAAQEIAYDGSADIAQIGATALTEEKYGDWTIDVDNPGSTSDEASISVTYKKDSDNKTYSKGPDGSDLKLASPVCSASN